MVFPLASLESSTVSAAVPRRVILWRPLAGLAPTPRLTVLVPLVPALSVVSTPIGVLVTLIVLPPPVLASTARPETVAAGLGKLKLGVTLKSTDVF